MKKFVELVKNMYRERYSVVMNKLVTEKIPITIFAFGPLENTIENIGIFRNQGFNVTNLINFYDPPQNLASELDFDIVTPEKFSTIQPRPEYVVALNVFDARIALKYAPNSKVILPTSSNTDEIYNIFMNHLTELQEVYESLIDEESRRTFCGYWLGNVANQISAVVHSNAPHYLLEGFLPKVGDVVIDCGAFNGNTSAFFADMGCQVYGFEMDKKNFELAKVLSEKKGFVVENLGLGSLKHKVKYTSNGVESKFDANGSEVAEIITLDSYIREKRFPRVDFIKFDVEGAELDILRGAVSTIVRFKPILALSAYHKWDDFWVLMNFVKSLRPDYEFALRQYSTQFDDEPEHFLDNGLGEFIYNLGLEVKEFWYNECVLFAR